MKGECCFQRDQKAGGYNRHFSFDPVPDRIDLRGGLAQDVGILAVRRLIYLGKFSVAWQHLRKGMSKIPRKGAVVYAA